MEWDQVVKRGKAMNEVMMTARISSGWGAYITDDPAKRVTGLSSESEAVGELYRTYFEEIVRACRTIEITW